MSIRERGISPISVPTSQNWDNDGSGYWSTFAVQVGSPSQIEHLLVSTASDSTWVVIPDGCPTTAPSNCNTSRGGLYETDNSSTWTDIGLFELDLETNLGYTGNGDFGFDTIVLGYPGGGGPSLTHQVVAGMATTEFWLGSFGLDPEPCNFTNFADPQPSYLRTLYSSSMIPSLSWGYTAGAVYRYDKVQASLTLGGYDQSRFSSNDVAFSMYSDVARRFIVSLVSASFYETTSSPESPVSVFIDSTIPFLYLPLDMCKDFEDAFGLTWNTTSQLYTIDDPLTAKDTNVTLQIANERDQRVNISIPFAAFNLTATYPLSEDPVAYFPLRQAENETQYTLGRVFLQESYLMADYERQKFSVFPTKWPVPSQDDIRTIYSPSVAAAKHRHDIHIIIGAVVGGVVLLTIIAISACCMCYKKMYSKKRQPSVEETSISTDSRLEIQDKPELDASRTMKNELDADETVAKVPELEGEITNWHELASSPSTISPVYSEMAAISPVYSEMAAREPVGLEMLASLSYK